MTTHTDLIARLRGPLSHLACDNAADALEALKQQNASLTRERLEHIGDAAKTASHVIHMRQAFDEQLAALVAERAKSAEQYVARLNQIDALTKEHEFACEIGADYRDKWMAAQAREAKLRGHMLNIASACRIWGGEAERARKMLEECLALPTDDSALMERLKEERERCASAIEFFGAAMNNNYGSECADAIRSMI